MRHLEFKGAGPLDGARVTVPDSTLAVVLIHTDYDGRPCAGMTLAAPDGADVDALEVVGALHDLADHLHDATEGAPDGE